MPKSNEHPEYPDSFMKGLRLALNTTVAGSENMFEVVTENVNYGTPVPTQNSLKRLISENKVHLIVGLLNNDVAGRIGKILKDEKVPAIISNAGENFMLTEVCENSYLFFNTLNLFQASFEAGKYSVSEFGSKVVVVTSDAEIGYDALFAFQKGVEAAGGKVSETIVLSNEKEDNWDETLRPLKNNSISCIFALLNGKKANCFFRNANQRELNIPIITTSFAADDHQIKHLGGYFEGTQHFSIWNSGLKTKENKRFVTAYQSIYKQIPTQFGFLGYRSGLLAGDSVSRCTTDLSGEYLKSALAECKINSPAGQVSINKRTGQINNSLFLCQSRLSTYNIPENIVLDKFYSDDNLTELFSSLDTHLRSGYFNPYLFM